MFPYRESQRSLKVVEMQTSRFDFSLREAFTSHFSRTIQTFLNYHQSINLFAQISPFFIPQYYIIHSLVIISRSKKFIFIYFNMSKSIGKQGGDSNGIPQTALGVVVGVVSTNMPKSKAPQANQQPQQITNASKQKQGVQQRSQKASKQGGNKTEAKTQQPIDINKVIYEKISDPYGVVQDLCSSLESEDLIIK
ncbi:hypothetical protein FGO68_gene3663 [Halteria grandinella]|uniref:Uncharacterized protein n=1 Tax=Halteria grandinella TaxID=5974 RepID=A0A8J8SY06_HALGN|nr:hypothetical protein FGO68_gene3663 [Halteria grandinella]